MWGDRQRMADVIIPRYAPEPLRQQRCHIDVVTDRARVVND